jgi:hypothetical protein
LELFFAEGNTILNEQTIIQKRRKHNKAWPNGCDQ